MRKSLDDIQQIERYLLGQMDEQDQQHFQIRLLTEHSLHERVSQQKQTYRAIRRYGRHKLQAELDAVYLKQSDNPDHRPLFQKIRQLFTQK